MITKTRNIEIYGDMSAGYDVVLDRVYTLGDFIDEIITFNEWGDLYVGFNATCTFKDMLRFSFCKNSNQLLTDVPQELKENIIKNVSSHGGWTKMSYFVEV